MVDGTENPMPRTGIRWTREEENRLFAAVRAGTPIETLITEFGRTRGALNSRVSRWLPRGDAADHNGDTVAALHQLLIDHPDYQRPVGVRDELRQLQIRPPARDHNPEQTLPGNPHADIAEFVDDHSYPAAALREAILAVAFELRTANLIAAATLDENRLDLEINQRLGNSDPRDTR